MRGGCGPKTLEYIFWIKCFSIKRCVMSKSLEVQGVSLDLKYVAALGVPFQEAFSKTNFIKVVKKLEVWCHFAQPILQQHRSFFNNSLNVLLWRKLRSLVLVPCLILSSGAIMLQILMDLDRIGRMARATCQRASYYS